MADEHEFRPGFGAGMDRSSSTHAPDRGEELLSDDAIAAAESIFGTESTTLAQQIASMTGGSMSERLREVAAHVEAEKSGSDEDAEDEDRDETPADDARDAPEAAQEDGSADQPDEPEDAAGAETGDEDPAEDDPEEVDPRETRFLQLVEERFERCRYSHPMARVILTPEELQVNSMVERRASVWVPASTFVATVVSAVAAVVLAVRLRTDPSQLTSGQILVIVVTVAMLAASFVVLLRSEVHFDRLKPKGRLVRADVADAYETVRDAPRRLLGAHADHEVLVRVAGLLPAAERLVDSLVEYTSMGGVKVKAHPAYERLLRMRAEIEALEIMLDESYDPNASEAEQKSFQPLPTPEQVVQYASLSDIAEFVNGPGDPLERQRRR